MKRKFAVFDIDGTFFRSHLFWEVVLELAKKELLHPEVNHYALDMYDSWKRRSHSRAFEDFDHNTITKLKELIADVDPAAYDAHVKQVLEPRLDHVYVYTKNLKETLQKQGYFTLAISGSRAEEVDIFAKHHKFDDWIGQTFHRTKDNKKYTGEVTATFNDKELLLKEFVKKHGLTYDDSYGIGDTSGDISMLELVENPIAFNPNHSLLEHAQKKGWKIVVERKSIAYTLEASDGTYILAKTDI